MNIDKLTRREQPALALVPHDPITTLRFVGRDHATICLAVAQRTFTVGAGGCDVVIPRGLSSAISEVHASFERVGSGLLVRDLGSKNGTFASLSGPRCESFHVQPGDTFWLANVEMLATDPYLEALRAHLACHLGLLRDAAIDDALASVASGDPLLLLGPSGTGARRLAAVIHATSPHRNNPRITGLSPLYLLNHAHGATVFIDVDRLPALSARYVATLFDRARGLRLVFAATDERRARTCLDHYRDGLRTIPLVPLAHRLDDVPHLVQFHWATECASDHTVSELGPAALRALTTYIWPRNLDELFDQSPRILAYHQHGGVRRAAAALGIAHQTLAQHLARIDFPILGQAEREPPLSRSDRVRTEIARWTPRRSSVIGSIP